MGEKLAELPVFSNLKKLNLGGLQIFNFNREAFKLFVDVSDFLVLKQLKFLVF